MVQIIIEMLMVTVFIAQALTQPVHQLGVKTVLIAIAKTGEELARDTVELLNGSKYI